MNAASRLALAERKARAIDTRAARYKDDDWRRHLSALTPKGER